MTDLTPPVFVYGTLLFAEVTRALGINAQRLSAATLSDYQRRTVRLSPRGNFPAIIPQPTDCVEGALLSLERQTDLVLMDQFEGIEEGYYERKLVQVTVGQQSRDAFVYVCGARLRPFLDGAWEPDRFRRDDLERYVRNLESGWS